MQAARANSPGYLRTICSRLCHHRAGVSPTRFTHRAPVTSDRARQCYPMVAGPGGRPQAPGSTTWTGCTDSSRVQDHDAIVVAPQSLTRAELHAAKRHGDVDLPRSGLGALARNSVRPPSCRSWTSQLATASPCSSTRSAVGVTSSLVGHIGISLNRALRHASGTGARGAQPRRSADERRRCRRPRSAPGIDGR